MATVKPTTIPESIKSFYKLARNKNMSASATALARKMSKHYKTTKFTPNNVSTACRRLWENGVLERKETRKNIQYFKN